MGKLFYQKLINLFYLHPLLLAIFPILAFYNSNINKIRFTRIVETLEISVGLTIGIWLLLYSLVGNRYKTSLLVSYFLLLFYSYGHVYSPLDWLLYEYANGQNSIGLFVLGLMLSLWLILLIGGAIFIIKLRKNLIPITQLINKISIFLIIISLLQIFYFNLKFNYILSINPLTSKVSGLSNSGDKKTSLIYTNLPNIYYIILDGYANSEVLERIYGYDNNTFEAFLKKKGFNIASKARSNYALTYLSLASSLNMKYINYLADMVGKDSTNAVIASDMLKNNELLKFLGTKGYKTINFNSGRRISNNNKFADLNITCIKDNDYITALLLTTILRPLENILSLQNQHERVLCTFSKLATIREEVENPIFVFAHIVSPHPPFVFGANGEPIKDIQLNQANNIKAFANKEAYVNQLKFINKKMEELVEELTSDKNNLPIIIIQADHGSAATPGMEEYNPNLIQERMKPFVASYLPGKNNFIHESVTPVNIFRLIFNNYFNTNYQILENRVYFSSYGKPYNFVDVTDNIWQKDTEDVPIL
ncbi:hypothetical protein HYW43_03905 [Candidatus Daviesbacteria bacterium]|nr:hypothetical protein [Candidatus Daviesbacteria bacterium]